MGTSAHEPVESSTTLSRWQQSLRNWLAPLAIAVAGYLVFETFSGLVILFFPFSISTQVVVLVHTGIGIVFLVPCCWYLLRHLAKYWDSPVSHIVVMGYLGGAAVLVCLLSGAVLTVQAAFGARISYAWDTVHIVSTFATLVFVAFHIIPLAFRERRIVRNLSGTFRGAARSYAKRGTPGVSVQTVCTCPASRMPNCAPALRSHPPSQRGLEPPACSADLIR